MARLLNALFARAVSYDDLLKESVPYLSNPELPAGPPEAMAHFDGRTLWTLDHYKCRYSEHGGSSFAE